MKNMMNCNSVVSEFELQSFFYVQFWINILAKGTNLCIFHLGTSGGVMVSKVDKQTYTSEFDSHWRPCATSEQKSLVNYLCIFHPPAKN